MEIATAAAAAAAAAATTVFIQQLHLHQFTK